MTDTFESFGFPADYRCEIVPEAPPGGAASPAAGSALRIRVELPDGTAWERSWAGISPHYPLTGAYAAPSGRHLVVVSRGQGFYVPVEEPDRFERLPAAPLRGIARVPEREIVVFWGFQDLVAYGPDGMLWWLQRLSEDDLEILRIERDGIHGTAWDASGTGEERVPFRVDPSSGRVEGGWAPPTLVAGAGRSRPPG